MLVTYTGLVETQPTIEVGTLTFDFDPDLLLEELATSMLYLATSEEHCGVCIRRNKIYRTHSPIIHLDEEDPDFLDDSFQWSYIHPDEVATWLT
jgi:hypothetical protein